MAGLSFQELLGIEDSPEFVDARCPQTGIIAWPAVRLEFFRTLVGDLVFPSAPLVPLERHLSPGRVAVGFMRSAIHNLWTPLRASDVMLVATGAGLVPRRGRAFNRHVDYFAGVLGNRSFTVESLHAGMWSSLARSNRRLQYLFPERVVREVLSRVRTRPAHARMMSELIDLASRRAYEIAGWEISREQRTHLVRRSARRIATYPIEARAVDHLLRRVRPRLAIVEEACYGRMAVFNATARAAGVTVAEFQHGMVTSGHDAYNVAPSLAASAGYRSTQPSAFLAYGKWWTEQFSAPVEKRVVVGNPHRSETLRNWRPSPKRDNLLVIGDGVETDAYLNFCIRLAASMPRSYRVVFRPHPLERERVSIGETSVSIDLDPDIYSSFAGARAVVAEASTVLFEAVGLVPTVLVWDTPKSKFYLGSHRFPSFRHPEDIAAMIDGSTSTDPPGEPPLGVWADDDWETRFSDFVHSVLE